MAKNEKDPNKKYKYSTLILIIVLIVGLAAYFAYNQGMSQNPKTNQITVLTTLATTASTSTTTPTITITISTTSTISTTIIPTPCGAFILYNFAVAPLVMLDSNANPASTLILIGNGNVNIVSQQLENQYSITITPNSEIVQAYDGNRILIAGYYNNQTYAAATQFMQDLETVANTAISANQHSISFEGVPIINNNSQIVVQIVVGGASQPSDGIVAANIAAEIASISERLSELYCVARP